MPELSEVEGHFKLSVGLVFHVNNGFALANATVCYMRNGSLEYLILDGKEVLLTNNVSSHRFSDKLFQSGLKEGSITKVYGIIAL